MSQRTCLVAGQYPPVIGGVGQSAQRVAHLLAAAGFGVDVAVMQKHPEALPLDRSIETTAEGEVRVHRVKVHHPAESGTSEAETLTRYNREMFQALDHLQRRHRYDVLHGFFLYPAGFVATAVGRLHGIPTIVSIRGNDVGKYVFDPLRLPFVRVTLERADRVTSVATSLTDLADRMVAPIAHKARTILNSVDLEGLGPGARPDVPVRGLVIGSAGLFRYKKGLVYLFQALAELDSSFDYTLLLAGDWFKPEDRLPHEQALAEHGLDGHAHVTGRIAPERMPDYLRLFDVLVFPSLFSEGCPRVLLEAMALGKAVIGTRSGAIPEIVRDRENGLLVDPGSTRELRSAIAELVRDPALRARLGEQAARTARCFSPERERQAWLDVYRSALAERSPA
jgi:glycosyltransferase involved in cell wall biosynthesis